MSKYIFGVILLFTVLYYGFHPGVTEAPSFGEIFDFGFNVVIRPFEVLASIRDGVWDFATNMIDWFESLFIGG